MQRKYPMPQGPVVGRDGIPFGAGHTYLSGIQRMSETLKTAHEVDNLDGGTSYSNDELRDKLIEILNALKS